jgi:hypothetical protein
MVNQRALKTFWIDPDQYHGYLYRTLLLQVHVPTAFKSVLNWFLLLVTDKVSYSMLLVVE